MQNVLTQIFRRLRASNFFFKDSACDSHVDKTIKEINDELNKVFEAEYVAKKKHHTLRSKAR